MKNLDWIKHPAITQEEVARRLGVAKSLFTKKLNGKPMNKNRPAIWQFSPEELEKLNEIRWQILKELT